MIIMTLEEKVGAGFSLRKETQLKSCGYPLSYFWKK
jgi:hypothetical protein